MLWAVLMAGGSGTRFWPESRLARPKQFLRLFGKKTLLEQTRGRLAALIPRSRTLVVTHASYARLASRLLKLARRQVLGEPCGRNTAPCAILAASLITRRDPEAVLALLPADHRIEKAARFRRALRAAAAVASDTGLPVTFGIKPAFAHTGYGYLETAGGHGRRSGFPVLRLKQFHEKPSKKTAERFLRSGRFYWNSGIFVWRADRLLEAAARLLPSARALASRIGAAADGTLPRSYARMPNISIDYGLMERLRGRILTMPVDLGWHDLGGWQSLADLLPKDRSRNAVSGEAVLAESAGNLVKAGRRLVALVGVNDLVVVDTPDALLVCPKDKTERIRGLVERLKKTKKTRYL